MLTYYVWLMPYNEIICDEFLIFQCRYSFGVTVYHELKQLSEHTGASDGLSPRS